MPRQVILVKHALPVLDAGVPPRDWRLGPEGEEQAQRLGRALRRFQPCRLVASREPKAQRTAELVAGELDVEFSVQPGLEEFDRPALAITSRAAHAALNAAIFEHPARPVLGSESGDRARERFAVALVAAASETAVEDQLIVVTHGTVISLLVAAHNPVDGFELWQRLHCASFVVLDWPSLGLREVVDSMS